MSLINKISEDLKTAMKEKNLTKLSVLRVLKSELQRSEQSVNGKVDLKDSDVIKVAKKLIEGIKETTNNVEEISTLESYLPKQLPEEKIKEIISMLPYKDMGAVMKFFKSNYDGQYDGKQLSSIVKSM